MNLYIDAGSKVGFFVYAFSLEKARVIIPRFGGRKIRLEVLKRVAGITHLNLNYQRGSLSVMVPTMGEFNNALRMSEAKRMRLDGYDYDSIFKETGIYKLAFLHCELRLTKYEGY